MGFGNCNLNINFLLIEKTRALNKLKKLKILWPANY
jgi:hypothetical protein